MFCWLGRGDCRCGLEDKVGLKGKNGNYWKDLEVNREREFFKDRDKDEDVVSESFIFRWFRRNYIVER